MHLLFEIGTEEMPARFLATIYRHFLAAYTEDEESLAMFGLELQSPDYYTCKRLAIVGEIKARTVTVMSGVKHGPKLQAAVQNGGASRALQGFCQKFAPAIKEADLAAIAQRLDAILQVPNTANDTASKSSIELYEDAQVRLFLDVDKIALTTQKTVTIEETITACWTRFIAKLEGIRLMRWGLANNNSWHFVRPVQSVLLQIDSTPLSVALPIADGLQAGHTAVRVQRSAKPLLQIQIPNAVDYASVLYEYEVVVSSQKRQADIALQIEAHIDQLSTDSEGLYEAVLDENLQTELVSITEWPHISIGVFPKHYLSAIPAKAIIDVLHSHQRYIPLQCDGQLIEKFLVVNDIESTDLRQVMDGHQRVVRPRLEDVAFHVQRDVKRGLSGTFEALDTISLFPDRGSLRDQAYRLQQLADALTLDYAYDKDALSAAVLYCRLDQATELVADISELEGQVQGYYCFNQAFLQGQVLSEVALQALDEAWLPSNKHGATVMPKSNEGLLTAILWRLDTLVVLLSANDYRIDSSRDPFGMRQLVAELLSLLQDTNLKTIVLSQLIDSVCDCLLNDNIALDKNKVNATLLEAIFKRWLQQRPTTIAQVSGIGHAVLQGRTYQTVCLADLDSQYALLEQFVRQNSTDLHNTLQLIKRVDNILGKAAQEDLQHASQYKPQSTTAPASMALEQVLTDLNSMHANSQMSKDEHLSSVASLVAPLALFFEETFILADDVSERRWNLQLLVAIQEYLSKLEIDFKQLQIAGSN